MPWASNEEFPQNTEKRHKYTTPAMGFLCFTTIPISEWVESHATSNRGSSFSSRKAIRQKVVYVFSLESTRWDAYDCKTRNRPSSPGSSFLRHLRSHMVIINPRIPRRKEGNWKSERMDQTGVTRRKEKRTSLPSERHLSDAGLSGALHVNSQCGLSRTRTRTCGRRKPSRNEAWA